MGRRMFVRMAAGGLLVIARAAGAQTTSAVPRVVLVSTLDEAANPAVQGELPRGHAPGWAGRGANLPTRYSFL